jgi:phosphate transport system substrate-binding protein
MMSSSASFCRKLVFICLISFYLLFAGCTNPVSKDNKTKRHKDPQTISISGSWKLYPLISELVIGFNEIYPNLHISVVIGSPLNESTDLSFKLIARESLPEGVIDLGWDTANIIIPVATNAVLPIVNSSNPYLKELSGKGISKQQFRYIFVESTLDQWGQLIGLDSSYAIHTYVRTDISVASDSWSTFLNASQMDMVGLGVYGDPGMVSGMDRFLIRRQGLSTS